MKKIIIIILLSAAATHSQNVPHLFELRGLEDSLGNTHLFYRYGGTNTSCWQKDIYHFDLINNIDTLFIPDFGYIVYPGSGCEGNYIFDYEVFDNDPSKFIYGGYHMWIDPVPILIRYDGEIQLPGGGIGGITEIEISNQNDSLVYAGLGGGLFKSTDGGYNFAINLDSLAWIDNAMISLSKNDDSQIYCIDQNKLMRSEDEGQSYIIVDDDIYWSSNYEKDLYYDADEQHIYGVSTSSNESALLVSDGNGDPFTWNSILTTPGKIWFTLDEQYQGEVYYSYKKYIYKSTDFGNTFSLYKELDQKITGLYKKSSTNILYASTMFRIYEITPDSIRIIKSITPASENYNWYPLSVGNYWYYEKFIIENGTTQFVGYETRHIVDNIVKQNGKKYFKIVINYSGSSTDSLFIRLDSTTAQIFAFDHNIGDELFFEDLSAELGDTVCYEYNPAWTCQYVQLEEEFSVFGLTTLKKVYEPEAPGSYFGHSLVKGIGLYRVWNGDTVPFWAILNGCVINGIVYGDTTVVSVEDEIPNLPTEFSLSQNYPNPFNPSTMIRYEIPGQARNDNMLVVLKVYDVLGDEIATLVNEEKPAGSYEVEFNGRDLINQTLPSGIYFYQLRAGSFVQTKKMLLLK